MDSHITGPVASGHGSVPCVRALVFEAGKISEGVYELGVVLASPLQPVFVEMRMTDEVTFDGSWPEIVIFTAESVEHPNIGYGVINYNGDIVQGYTGNQPQPLEFICYENVRLYATYMPVDATNGRTTVMYRASGLGSMPLIRNPLPS